MEDGCRFNTKLLHGKTSAGYGQREILPPVSQVTAFQYESMEELEKFRAKFPVLNDADRFKLF
jgi:O-acetylhomoserine (thiol)-lyase